TASISLSCAALTCSFDGGPSSDSDGAIVAYAWTFGDGTSGSGRTVTHTYAFATGYRVTLTVTDDASATATASTTITLIVLTARGSKVRGLQSNELSWSGSAGASYEIYRDRSKIATVQATVYTDSLKGGATHTYKVCAASESICSNMANVGP